MACPVFGESKMAIGSVDFLRFLQLTQIDAGVRDALEKGNFAGIDAFPGLNSEERELLKLFNWSKMEVGVNASALHRFTVSAASTAGIACERSVATERIQERCWKI